MAEAIQGTPVYGSAQGVQIAARLDSTTSGSPQRLCMIVEITIDPGLHVYGQPIPEGFIPLSIEVAPAAGLSVGAVVFPAPVWHQMEGLDEEFFIYEGMLCVAVPVMVSAEHEPAVLPVKIRYQACGAMGCFMPQTVELHLPVPV